MKIGFAYATRYRSEGTTISLPELRDNEPVPDVTRDPIWQNYERAADAHRRAMRARVQLSEELARRFEDDRLSAWDDAHREE